MNMRDFVNADWDSDHGKVLAVLAQAFEANIPVVDKHADDNREQVYLAMIAMHNFNKALEKSMATKDLDTNIESWHMTLNTGVGIGCLVGSWWWEFGDLGKGYDPYMKDWLKELPLRETAEAKGEPIFDREPDSEAKIRSHLEGSAEAIDFMCHHLWEITKGLWESNPEQARANANSALEALAKEMAKAKRGDLNDLFVQAQLMGGMMFWVREHLRMFGEEEQSSE